MIDAALAFLETELNTHLAAGSGSTSARVTVGRLVYDTGEVAVMPQTLGAALLAVEEESSQRSLPTRGSTRGAHAPLQLRLTIVIAANFTHYPTGLAQLSRVLEFFRLKPVFDRADYAQLDARIERLAVDLQPLTIEQLSALWNAVGGKQLPSLVYSVRLQARQA